MFIDKSLANIVAQEVKEKFETILKNKESKEEDKKKKKKTNK